MSSSIHYFVAIDGSNSSWAAWDAVMYLLNAESDRVSTITVSTKTKDNKFDSSDKYHSQRIMEELKKANTGLPEDRLDLRVAFKQDEQTSRRVVIDAAVRNKADFLATGLIGRKNETGMNAQRIMGGTTDFSLREFKDSSIIVKASWSAPKPGDEAVFVVGVDGSANSRKGYETARSLMKSNDVLYVVHVKSINEDESDRPKQFASATLEAKYGEELKDLPKASFVLLTSADVPEALCAFCEEKKAHFICLGADGMKAFISGKQIMGSVSDSVVQSVASAAIISQINVVD